MTKQIDPFDSEHSTNDLDQIIKDSDTISVGLISDTLVDVANDLKNMIDEYDALYGAYEDACDSLEETNDKLKKLETQIEESNL